MSNNISGGYYRPLSEKDMKNIHKTTLRVLEDVGFLVKSPAALDYFEEAGANIDLEQGIVRIKPELVEKLISRAPSSILLAGKDEKYDIFPGEKRVYMGTGGTALFVLDSQKEVRRRATLNDLRNITRLVDNLDNIHFFLLPSYPNELPVEKVDVNRFLTGMAFTDKHVMGGVYTLDGVKNVIRMAEVVAGSAEKLRERPIISFITCGVSPMMIDREYGEMLIHIAKSGLPVAYPSEPLCGATSPVTLAGNIVTYNIDSLIGVILSQLVNPGTPVIYGCISSSVDFRDMKYLGGPIEAGLINAAAAQMAHFYKLPLYATGGMSDTKILDAQAGFESAMTVMLPALAGANLIHDAAGLMEFAKTVSYEKYIIDNEILGMVMRAVKGIQVNDETLAFEEIKKAGPGGSFISSRHTRKFMHSEHYKTNLVDRDTREVWEQNGRKDIYKKARQRVSKLLYSDIEIKIPSEILNDIYGEIPDIVPLTEYNKYDPRFIKLFKKTA